MKRIVVGLFKAWQTAEIVYTRYKGVHDGPLPSGSMIVLDFSEIEGTNASYIKASVLWLLTCEKLSVTSPDSASRHPYDPRPYDLYACVTGLSAEVLAEFQEFLKPRGIPLLFATHFKDRTVEEASLLGQLDPALRSTLDAITKPKTAATAPSLHRACPEQQITVTAWNNRLNDLHALRLVRRIRAGRAWEYEPVAKEVIWE